MTVEDRFACVVERPRGALSVAVGFVCETLTEGGGALEALIAGEGAAAAGARLEVRPAGVAVTADRCCVIGVDIAAPVRVVPRAEIERVLGGDVRWEDTRRCLDVVHEARARFAAAAVGPA